MISSESGEKYTQIKHIYLQKQSTTTLDKYFDVKEQ